MKKINTAYRIITGIFAAFMLVSAIPDILVVPEAVTMVFYFFKLSGFA